MLPSDQSEVQKIVKKSGSSFYWGMKVLPSNQMRAMFSIYAYCRTVDDIADDIKDKISMMKGLIEEIGKRFHADGDTPSGGGRKKRRSTHWVAVFLC